MKLKRFHSLSALTIQLQHAKRTIRKRLVRMKSMVHKTTRVIIVIAICWFLAYGVGIAASHCCSAITNICSPSGVRGPLMPVIDAHCQPSPSHYLNPYWSEGEGAGSVCLDSNEPTTCCSAPPCIPIGFAAHPAWQLPPSSPSLQESGKSFTSESDHSSIPFSHIRHTRYHPTTPIFLLTKSIIC